MNRLADFGALVLAKGGYDLEGRKDSDWLGDKAMLIERYVAQGGGFLALHSGVSGYDLNPVMVNLAKAVFTHHPQGLIEVSYEGTAPAFPVPTPCFSGQDEQYFVRFVADNTQHFLRSSNPQHGLSPAGWAHGHGAGRVLCITPGHTREILTNRDFQTLLAGSLRWCLGAGFAA